MMDAIKRASLLRSQLFQNWTVWSYWLAWTVVVIVDAASHRRGEYQFWLLSPYAWCVAPFVLWWTIPRNARYQSSLAWPLFILAWAAWRVLSLEFAAINPWLAFADDSTFKLLQLPLNAALAGTALALAFSRPIASLSAGLAKRAGLLVGLCAGMMQFRALLLDLGRWQTQPIINGVRAFDVLLIALLLAVSTHWARSAVRDYTVGLEAPAVKPVGEPRFAGFGSLFSLAALSMFGAALAVEAVNSRWTRFGIEVFGAALPVALATWSGARAWRRAGSAMRPSPILMHLRTMAVRAAVIAGVGSLWFVLIWGAAPRAGSNVVEALRSLPGPLWSVRAIPGRAAIGLNGELTPGVADAVRSAVRAHPAVRFVELNSPGGLLREAQLIAMTVQSRGLITVARGECASACTGILASGRERWLLKSTDVGLHAPSVLGLPAADASEHKSQVFRSLGMSEALAQRGAAVPSWDIWYPTEAELLDFGLITRVVTEREYRRAAWERVTQRP